MTKAEAGPIGPMARYRAAVEAGLLRPDAAQRAAVEKLQLLHMRLSRLKPRSRPLFVLGLFGFLGRGEAELDGRHGLYLYGGVGRGKSMLMDLFFEGAPTTPKRRVHFHAFMQEVHAGVAAARAADARDPIAVVADAVADSAALLCFDEMQVSDIADAMILGRLFEALFARGVAMVVTSNRHPHDLYENGLNRALFVPFIELIEARLDIHQLDGPIDHRRARMRGLGVYHAPLGREADAALDRAFAELTRDAATAPLTLAVNGRTVTVPRHADGVGRADFATLCEAPLGPADHLAIANALDTLVLDHVPMLSRARADAAKRFVTLIDALYEARAHLFLSAAAEPEQLFTDGPGAFEFERCASRLWEMRSADWPPKRG